MKFSIIRIALIRGFRAGSTIIIYRGTYSEYDRLTRWRWRRYKLYTKNVTPLSNNNTMYTHCKYMPNTYTYIIHYTVHVARKLNRIKKKKKIITVCYFNGTCGDFTRESFRILLHYTFSGATIIYNIHRAI